MPKGLHKEWTRIRREHAAWMQQDEGDQQLLGGWWGVWFTAVVLGGSGWIDPERLDGVLRLAITPLAVFWGFASYAQRQESKDEAADSAYREGWKLVLRRAINLASIIAVVGILTREAFERPAKEVFTVVVLFFVCMAITNAMAFGLGTDPPRFFVVDTPEASTRMTGTKMLGVDLGVALALTLLTVGVLAVLSVLGLSGLSQPLTLLFEGQAPVWGMLSVFWLYRGITGALWGRGLGGRWMNLRLRDYKGKGPGWRRALSRAALETAWMAAIIALAQTLPPAQFIGLGAAGLIVGLLVGLQNKRRSWRDVLTGTQYEPTAI